MKCLLSVCLVVLAMAVIARMEATLPAQAMQKGVSVRLAATANAVPMPEADNADASIVTVTSDAKVYFGINSVTSDTLAERIKDRQFNLDRKLYVKADARTPYHAVLRILDIARTGGVAAPVLLTTQSEPSKPGVIVPPRGLEVLLDQPPADSESVVVQVIGSAQQAPILKVNNREIPGTALQSVLSKFFQNRSQRVVALQAEGSLPFAEVVHVIDVCHASGVKAALLMPAL